MLEIYCWTTPNGYKPLMFAEEAGIEYRTIGVNISTGAQHEPEYLKISPNNRIPALIDHLPSDGGDPVSLFESGAMLQYLGAKTGKLYAERQRQRGAIDQWLHWQIGGFGPMIGQYMHFLRSNEDSQYALQRYHQEGQRLYRVLDQQLKGREFICGEQYTIADIAIYPWIVYSAAEFQDYENVTRYQNTIAQRPATQRAYEKGALLRKQ
ncbi:MAG: glutathione S-transferase N-terminal domain-containing protein [Pseudomonadales bacterium]|nr:glutathione S-transferase N-terminal domain-containing protein [Pseudomonadales bacterium]